MATPGYKMIGPDGRESLPFDSDALPAYARQGYVQPQTTIFDPMIGQWLPASGVAALQSMNDPASAPAVAQTGYSGNQAIPNAPPSNSGMPTGFGTQYSYGSPAGGYMGSGGYAPVRQSMPRVAVIAIALGAGLIVGGIAVAVSKRNRLRGQVQTISTYDGGYSVQVPALWAKWPSKNPRVIEYLDRGAGTGVTLIKVTHTAAQPGELDSIAATSSAKSALILKSSGPTVPATQLKVGGYDARQIEMDDGGVGLHFRMTYIATVAGVYRVSDFERKADLDNERPKMDRIISTFHAVP